MKKKKTIGIIRQVSLLFFVGVVTTGILTYFSQLTLSDESVKLQTEQLASEIADETIRSVKESSAWEWLLRYWYENSGELDIEYDVDYSKGTGTEEKYRLLKSHHTGIVLKYADTADLEELPEEDQKLCAEIAYSWLITRINQIKRAYHVDYLFCVLTEAPYERQFFLFSAADAGAVRGTNYEEVYPLGKEVSVAESQQQAMQSAIQHTSHLADAGAYVDYYAWLGNVDGHDILIGMTYSLSTLKADISTQTTQRTSVAILHQVTLSLFCLLLLYHFVLQPLQLVQQNIRLYKQTKDSAAVKKNLAKVQSRNEISQLSEDVTGLAEEIDDYLHKIETITAEKERIGTELALASRIQASMLPNIFPAFPGRKEFDIYASMNPAKKVGGDFYDFFLIDDDHLCLIIADVSGKGIPAALFMTVSKAILANNARMGKSAAEILADANTTICANNPEDMFVTVWLGILEISTGILRTANAGHEYPAMKEPGKPYELKTDRHSFVIGGMEGITYREKEIHMEPGTKIFVYTDGVPEAMNPDDEMFGTDRILAALNEDPEASPDKTLENVGSAVKRFVKETEQFDDMTMMCLTYNGHPS